MDNWVWAMAIGFSQHLHGGVGVYVISTWTRWRATQKLLLLFGVFGFCQMEAGFGFARQRMRIDSNLRERNANLSVLWKAYRKGTIEWELLVGFITFGFWLCTLWRSFSLANGFNRRLVAGSVGSPTPGAFFFCAKRECSHNILLASPTAALPRHMGTT